MQVRHSPEGVLAGDEEMIVTGRGGEGLSAGTARAAGVKDGQKEG